MDGKSTTTETVAPRGLLAVGFGSENRSDWVLPLASTSPLDSSFPLRSSLTLTSAPGGVNRTIPRSVVRSKRIAHACFADSPFDRLD